MSLKIGKESLLKATHHRHISKPWNLNSPHSSAKSTHFQGQNLKNLKAQHFIERSPAKTRFFNRPASSDTVVILLGSTMLLSGYLFWKTNQDEVFVTGRIRTMAISWDLERTLGAGLKSDSLEETKEFGRLLSDDDPRAREVRKIANRIIQATEEDFFEIRGKLQWDIHVRENPTANAFCLPGGTITVLTGLIDLMLAAEEDGKIDDGSIGIACVIAHEIAHGYCRHGTEKLSWLPLEYPLKYMIQDSTFFRNIFMLFSTLPHSRLCENEADAVGFQLMSRAGYDPTVAVKVWEILDKTPSFLEWTSTHPVGENRTGHALQNMKKSYELYLLNKFRFSPSRKFGTFWDWLFSMKTKEPKLKEKLAIKGGLIYKRQPRKPAQVIQRTWVENDSLA